MKVYTHGFNFIEGKVPLNDLFSEIEINSIKTDDNRIIAVTNTSSGKYWSGIILSIRDVHAFTKIKEQGGAFKMTSQSLEDDTRPVDFNFFVLNAETKRGLYQHYHQSASLNKFCYLLKQEYRSLRKRRLDQAITAVGGNIASTKTKKKIAAAHMGSLRYQLIPRPGTFGQCIEELHRLKVFEFQYAEFLPVEPTFQPLAAEAKRVTHRIVFQQFGSLETQKKAVIHLWKQGLLRQAKVIGVDPHDREQVYHLAHDLASFSNFDYDELTKNINIDSSDLNKTINECDITKHLLKVIKSHNFQAHFNISAGHVFNSDDDLNDE